MASNDPAADRQETGRLEPADSQLLPHGDGAEPAGGGAGRDSWTPWPKVGLADHAAGRTIVEGALADRILTALLWTSVVVVLIATLPIYLEDPVRAIQAPLAWVSVAGAVTTMVAALGRKLPFRIRYTMLAAALAIVITGFSTYAGITPTWVVLVLLFISSTGLFFGIPAAIGAGLALLGVEIVVAWGWIQGVLPAAVAANIPTRSFDFHRASVWARVLLSTTTCVAGLLYALNYVLRSLRRTVSQSQVAVSQLATEQEHRALLTEALTASEAKFSKVFRLSPIAIAMSELESARVTEANDAFLRTHGATREQVIGHSTVELGLIQQADRKRIQEALRTGGVIRNFTIKSRKLTGEPITLLLNAEVIEFDDRPFLLTMSQDVTERENAEAALRSSEEKFSNAFYANPNPMLISDPETGRILDANGAFFRIAKNAPREQVVGRTTIELRLWQDSLDRDRFAEMLRTAGSIRNFRVYGRTLRGEHVVVLLNSEMIDLEGRPAVLTMMQDITEAERAEVALRESEEKFSRAFRCGPTANTITDLKTGRYIEISEGFEKLTGYSRAEAIGRTSIELGIWPSTDVREAFMAQLAAEGSVHGFELETVNRRGESIFCVINADCLSIGGRRCVVMSAQDITDRKRAEAERAQIAERELRAREEFTRGLIAAQETERARIAGELHDSLGQNLLLLKNRAQLALGGREIPADLLKQLTSIEDMATRAIAEVRQISHDLHPYQLDQLGLTRALEGMIATAGRSTGIAITHKIDAADEVFSREDATHVFRIVQESINNIVKHAHGSAASVLLERDIREVRLLIEDNGIGFVPTVPGFGLKNIAERVRILGGTVKVDSAPGQGARIEIVIPIPEEAAAPDFPTGVNRR